MANFVYITLDTTPPSNPVLTIANGASFVATQLIDLTVGVSDGTTAGYQMKIWGDVDPAHNTNIKATETDSVWIPYATSPQIKLSADDGLKTINIRVRDDVSNPSSIASASIRLDNTIPVVTVTNPDVSKISKVAGKDSFSFTFSSSEDFVEYKVKLVGTANVTHDVGTLIPTTGGSQNTSGTGTFTTSTVTTVTIKGVDLESAGATTDGQKIVKVFVKDTSGNWNV